jgi:hypothetical protein
LRFLLFVADASKIKPQIKESECCHTQQEQQTYPPAYPADVGGGQWPAAQPYQQEAVPSGDVWMPQQREAVPPSEYDYSQSPPQPYPYQDGQDAGSGYYYNDQQQRY